MPFNKIIEPCRWQSSALWLVGILWICLAAFTCGFFMSSKRAKYRAASPDRYTYLTISSCVSMRVLRSWARGKFGECERGIKSCSRCSNSSFLSALHTSQVLNISPYAQQKHELTLFYKNVKVITAEVNLNFNYCSMRVNQYAESTWLYFFTSELCFCLETERKFTQVA